MPIVMYSVVDRVTFLKRKQCNLPERVTSAILGIDGMTALNRHRMTVDMLTAVTPGSLKTISKPGGATEEQLPCPKDAVDRSISMDPYLGHFQPIIEAR